MKILFLIPAPKKNMNYVLSPDIALGYLATAVRKQGHQPIILHMEADKVPYSKLITKIKLIKPDIIGLRVFSRDITDCNYCISLIREVLKNIYIVIGGPHPTMAPSQDLFDTMPSIDYGFKGEAEKGLPLLLDLIKNNQNKPNNLATIPGLIYHNSKNKISTNKQYFEPNLDQLGIPAWDLINFKKYSSFTFWAKPGKTAPILLTRGCPYSCEFCAVHLLAGKKIRKRSIAHVISEIELLHYKYNITNFDIIDDNLTADTNYAKEFCKEIIKRKININWACPCGIRLDAINIPLIKLMEQSGCYSISLGIESGSDKTLKNMNKGITTLIIKEKIAIISKNTNIILHGHFILGYPEETEADIKKTSNISQELPLSSASFYTFFPIPATPVYNKLIEKGIINKNDFQWNSLQQYHNISINKISQKLLKKTQLRTYIKFYSRPKILFKYLLSLRHKHQLKWVIGVIRNQLTKK